VPAVVRAVECRGFRNLTDARLETGAAVVVMHGANGAGKTNLLEAVYFGLTGRSFRAGDDRDVIRFGHQGARVELELSDGGTLLAALDRSGERRHLLGERPVAGHPDERPLVSVFHPDRLALVKGAPAHRRAHLDRLCGAIWPARADLRRRFGRTLAQRNALVARIKAGLGGADSLASWDERLAAEAEPLMAARAEAVGALVVPFAELAERLGLPEAEISYRPRADGDREELVAELARRREQDLGRAYTSYGPQLDEVELRLGDRALRRFGSQGQQRLVLLALLFAERTVLREAGRAGPLMLLDDVMSELDPAHRRLLVELLESGGGQALLTATEADHVPSAAALRISVSDGAAATGPVLRAA
jgi:DNA replication and repair protein RecF